MTWPRRRARISIPLQRVLKQLVGKYVFGEPEPGRFELLEAGRGLLEPEAGIGLDLDGLGGRPVIECRPGY